MSAALAFAAVAVLAALWPPSLSFAVLQVFGALGWVSRRDWRRFLAGWRNGTIPGIAFGNFTIWPRWAWMTGSAISLAVVLALWWWRRYRDKAKRLIGAKARAIRDAMARRMRELAPRPVLRPVPGGVS